MSYSFLGEGDRDTRQPMSADIPVVIGVTGISGYPSVSD